MYLNVSDMETFDFIFIVKADYWFELTAPEEQFFRLLISVWVFSEVKDE